MMRMLRRLLPPRFLPIARRAYARGQTLRQLMADWVVPPGFVRIKRRIDLELSLRLTSSESSILSRNSKFRNMYAGRRCFVIGNGPSLNKQDLAPLADEVTVVMNRFNKHPIIDKWKPTFFCMAEPRGDLTEESLPLFLQGIQAQAYFFRMEYKELFDEHKYVDPEKVYYLKTGGVPLRDWPASRHSIDLTRTIPGCQSTAHMALMLAVYLGCSPIYLLGLDHDWLAQPLVATHFYVDDSDFSMFSYKQMMEIMLNVWVIHEWIKDVASKQGVVIYNATAGGFLDVFPRVEFASLFLDK